MKSKRIIIIFSIIAVLCIGAVLLYFVFFRNKDPHSDDLLLNLSFNEEQGTTVTDSSGNLPTEDINYVYSHAVFMDSVDAPWRSIGIDGGSLLFDGNSTYITYGKNDASIGGSALTISVWVAPRAFEWDDPNAADNGTESLTGIISQSNKANNQGFILGYQRFGRLSFQVGIGDEWLTIWSNGDNLQKYAWNLVTATFDSEAGEMCLYLNGELVASRSIPSGSEIVPAKNRTLLVGRNGESERLAAAFVNVHSGLMDELKMYGCALTADEISDYYKSISVPEIPFEDIWLEDDVLDSDVYRPQFHASPYQNWMNEPHAPVYYNGMYHLFFQENMFGPYWKNICWGHFVSTDMVNWTPVKEAIVPTENTVVPDGAWSGCAAYDVNGVPLLFFTAGNDSFSKTEGLISNQNIGVAYPADLSDENLTDWVICDELAVIQQKGQGRTGEFRDPYVWKEGDIWCMVICSGSATSTGGTALLYATDTLELLSDGTVDSNWTYIGPVYEMENQSMLYGTSWELPIILPVSNENNTITKYMFVFSPAPASIADNNIYYFLGEFDIETGKFTPDEEFEGIPRRFDYGCNVFTGPSAIEDPLSGDIYMFSIMQDQRSAADQGAAGWAHTAGIARKIRLNDDGSDLMISPIDTLHTLEGETLVDDTNLTLDEANKLLSSVSGDMLYINAVISANDAEEFGISVKKGGDRDCTTFNYITGSNTITGETKNKGDAASANYVSGNLELSDGKLYIEIYIDRSLVEAFFNSSKSISMRAYTDNPLSQGIEMFADGDVTIDELYVSTMNAIED